MKYNARLKKLLIETSDLDQAYFLIMYTLKNMRLCVDLPLTAYERPPGPLTKFDSAAIALLELGESIGLHFDCSRHNSHQLDLTKVDV